MPDVSEDRSWLAVARETYYPRVLGQPDRVLKISELAELLTKAGYRNREGRPVTEVTLRGWEAPSGGVPKKAEPYLERILKVRAPGSRTGTDQGELLQAIKDHTLAVRDLAAAIRSRFDQQELRDQARAEATMRVLAGIAEAVGAPTPADIAAVLASTQTGDAEPDQPPAEHRARGTRRPKVGPARPGWEEAVSPELESRTA